MTPLLDWTSFFPGALGLLFSAPNAIQPEHALVCLLSFHLFCKPFSIPAPQSFSSLYPCAHSHYLLPLTCIAVVTGCAGKAFMWLCQHSSISFSWLQMHRTGCVRFLLPGEDCKFHAGRKFFVSCSSFPELQCNYYSDAISVKHLLRYCRHALMRCLAEPCGPL